jgi:WD40 repeat protein
MRTTRCAIAGERSGGKIVRGRLADASILRLVKGTAAIAALGTALLLTGAGFGGTASAPGHGILLEGYGKYDKSRILLWHRGLPVKALTPAEGGCGGGGDFCAEMSDGYWSPDGRSIAYEGDDLNGLAPPTPNIVVIRSDGTHPTWLAGDSGENDNATYGPPSWSPDGRHIVYEREITDWDTGITSEDFAIVDVRSRHERRLTAGSLATSRPVWGEAGIAYFTAKGIMLLNPKTGRARLVRRDFVEGVLAWSPGRVLAVAEPTHIVLLSASGQVLGKLPELPTAKPICDLAWSANGKKILVSTEKKGSRLARLWLGTVSTKHWLELPPVPRWRKDRYGCAVSWR